MFYHARRLRVDVRGIRRWLVAVALVTFAISVGTTYFAAFSVRYIQEGTLAPSPPREPLAFLRVVDPGETIDQIAKGNGATTDTASIFDTPGMAALLKQMKRSDDLFLTLPLGAFTSDRREFSAMANEGRVLVTSGHKILAGAAVDVDTPLVWGSMADAASGVTNTKLGPVAVRQVSGAALSIELVGGDGRNIDTGDQSLVRLSVDDARELGIYFPYTVADVVQSVSCYCYPSELVPLATRMTQAERDAGSNRVFYAIGYGGLIGPAERSAAAVEVLSTGFALGALAGICCFGAMAGALFWRHRRYAYSVERLHGASELALQARQQIVVLGAVTVPGVLGFLLVDAALRGGAPTPPWSSRGGILLPIIALTMQAGVGARTAIMVHRLGRWARRRGTRG